MMIKKAENSSTLNQENEKENSENLFVNMQNDFEILLKTEKWVFVWIKTFEGARFSNSLKCGGQYAKWCIGNDKYNDTDYCFW